MSNPHIAKIFQIPALSVRGVSGWRSLFLTLAISFVLLQVGASHANAANNSGKFLPAQRAINAPAGFSGLCKKYTWVCARTDQSRLTDTATLKLAAQINLRVNQQVREIEDQAQYGKEEYWALPTQRGGDCEDLVLLKKKLLMEQGVASQSLLIATVLDKKLNSHAVLILRTKAGDVVLDNLDNRIKPWGKTGYTFLKLQNPKSLRKWDAVLAGGVIDDRPTASR